jgi:hypothetical protein
MIQNKKPTDRAIPDGTGSKMSNRVPSWFAQSVAACVLSGESLFGSAQEATHQSSRQNQERDQHKQDRSVDRYKGMD